MGKVLQVRISVAAVRESERLRAVSPVQVPQQEEPAAVSAEIRRDLLRRTTETRADSPHKKEIPMTPVSHGKPCAGNPHARFDEGGVRIGGTEAERSTPQQKYKIFSKLFNE